MKRKYSERCTRKDDVCEINERMSLLEQCTCIRRCRRKMNSLVQLLSTEREALGGGLQRLARRDAAEEVQLEKAQGRVSASA